MANDIHISITNNDIPNIERALPEIKARALEMIGLLAEGYAKRLCPVDTGRLRNSISHDNDDNAVTVGTNVDYAIYVEMGTVHSRAQPYLKPAIVDHLDEYKGIIKDTLKGN